MTKIDQDSAIKFFNEHGYLVINSMRRSGKTSVLRKIIELNGDKRIGIRCIDYGHYKMQFNIYPNCEYIDINEHGSADKHFDILIGDEVFLQPNARTKTACAYTNAYIEHSLCPTEHLLEQIDEIKNSMLPYRFEVEFGQYM